MCESDISEKNKKKTVSCEWELRQPGGDRNSFNELFGYIKRFLSSDSQITTDRLLTVWDNVQA